MQQGSPAAGACLKANCSTPVAISGQSLMLGGDDIAAVDDQLVTQATDVRAAREQALPSQQVTLTILRQGKWARVAEALGE